MPSAPPLSVSRRSLIALCAALPFTARAALAEQGPLPPPGARERFVEVPGAQLWCWDSGGKGPAMLLLHPGTGSGAIWEKQYAALVRAGFRVAAYSRRGHWGSRVDAGADPGYAVDDLAAVADALALGRFHLIGCAAGGFVAPEYSLLHPERLRSLTLACSQGGIADPALRAAIDAVRPEALSDLPATFRELGPAYRAADPPGVERWAALEHSALAEGVRLRQKSRVTLDAAALGKIAVPVQVIAGGADLLMPPPLARRYAAMIPHSRFTLLPDCGHSAYWEQPDAFNRAVIGFAKGKR